jgi:hypothetical protein
VEEPISWNTMVTKYPRSDEHDPYTDKQGKLSGTKCSNCGFKTSHRNTDHCRVAPDCRNCIFVLGIFANQSKITIKINDYKDKFQFAEDTEDKKVFWSTIGVI